MRDSTLRPEDRAVDRLLRSLELTGGARHRAVSVAMALVDGARARRDERPFLDAFLQEFGLSNQEGIALMCIAEALLRIPDDATADRLIAEQLATGDWSAHAGKSESLFVNASTWGLMLTGGILELDPSIKTDAAGWMRKLDAQGGRAAGAPRGAAGDAHHRRRVRGGPHHRGGAGAQRARIGSGAVLLRHAGRGCAHAQGCRAILQILRTRDRRHRRSRRRARRARALEHFHQALRARAALFAAAAGRASCSAWCPRSAELARRAAAYGIQLTIDAEEADRLDLSLDVIEALARDSATREWPGLGLAVQAYSKRALDVIDWAAATARATGGRRMAVRLVKGAYWDSEIKRGQERGLRGYPVYTRKVTTDVSYLACAGRLFKHADVICPQFATHNAHSIASILELAPAGADVRISAAARHGAAAVRRGGAAGGRISPGSACMRRSASTRICSPIWCGGCWKTAPIPRS